MRKINPVVIKIDTLDQAQRVEKEKFAVVLLLPAGGPQEQLDVYESAARKDEDLLFYYSDNDEVKGHYEVEHPYALVLFRSFNDGRKIFGSPKPLAEETIHQFIDVHRHPWVSQLTPELAGFIFQKHKNALFYIHETKEVTKAFSDFYEQLARKYQGAIIFVTADKSSEIGVRLVDFLNAPKDLKSSARLVFWDNKRMFKYKLDDVSDSALEKFIEEFELGKLTPYYKTQEPPQHNGGIVKVAVGSTFEAEVVNNANNVFVLGYADWSDESMDVEADFESLAADLSDVEDLVFVKMEADANEHPLFVHDGYPTLKLYKKDDKMHPIEINTDRSVEGMLAFLEEQLGRKLVDDDDRASEDQDDDL